jgi:hypothetical protein
MDATHPILAAQAIAAVPAGDDLLGNRSVAKHEAIFLLRTLAKSDHFADEFVPRYNGRLAITLSVPIAPEERGAVIALQIACTDADCPHPDDNFFRTGAGDRPFLEAIVFGAVAYDRCHSSGERLSSYRISHQRPGGLAVSFTPRVSAAGRMARCQETMQGRVAKIFDR